MGQEYASFIKAISGADNRQKQFVSEIKYYYPKQVLI